MKIAQDKIKILVFQENLIVLRSYQSIEMKPLSLKNIKTLCLDLEALSKV